jgi:hypothetical protein
VTRINWYRHRRAKVRQPHKPSELDKAADRFLAQYDEPRHHIARHKAASRREIWITVGANCPWNTTPGKRQVHCFHSVEEAHKAGFTKVR